MSNQQYTFPLSRDEVRDTDGPVMLEGMTVLFDDRIGLYPVDLVAKKEAPQRKIKNK